MQSAVGLWVGHEPITRFEILDQSNGSGGFISLILGELLLDTSLLVFFETMEDAVIIDFIINVYSEQNITILTNPLIAN